VRQALSIDSLTGIYARLARRYDWQQRLIAGATDQHGRRILVESTVRQGDRALDCRAGGLPGAQAPSGLLRKRAARGSHS